MSPLLTPASFFNLTLSHGPISKETSKNTSIIQSISSYTLDICVFAICFFNMMEAQEMSYFNCSALSHISRAYNKAWQRTGPRYKSTDWMSESIFLMAGQLQRFNTCSGLHNNEAQHAPAWCLLHAHSHVYQMLWDLIKWTMVEWILETLA